jgi:hypothetical protein
MEPIIEFPTALVSMFCFSICRIYCSRSVCFWIWSRFEFKFPLRIDTLSLSLFTLSDSVITYLFNFCNWRSSYVGTSAFDVWSFAKWLYAKSVYFLTWILRKEFDSWSFSISMLKWLHWIPLLLFSLLKVFIKIRILAHGIPHLHLIFQF